jgi:hypothetical protein
MVRSARQAPAGLADRRTDGLQTTLGPPTRQDRPPGPAPSSALSADPPLPAALIPPDTQGRPDSPSAGREGESGP